ncbi:tRNA modification GTPase [Flavobacterium franklandianum]|uniref:tRNA modification GTPase n=1 Tax=Flavobacterium franklandianum TaxID=2594430 RepID=A0A553CTT7_9FLAO|nr:tRNA modification GTPase [Flavobacterium franklandianum]TRX23447.1 tRNA modification GTPase [Flavobacterium franklandianum]TRX23942.1 tRNA modification GTPase [Flavobacterium franklandianum]
MSKKLLLFIITILSLEGYSQITFEKGYIIDNSNQKIECLIKNIDWIFNPVNLEYKISEESEPISADIKLIKEFEIFKNSKFIRKTVKIDLSNENISNLSINKNPEFVEKTLFLRVLIEGVSNLYQYESNGLSRFFYTKNNSEQVEQLIYKNFFVANNTVATNNQFKQQLWIDLKCESIELNTVEKLEYSKNSLLKFFKKYYECTNPDSLIVEEKKEQRDLFNFSIRPRINNSSVSVQNLKVTTSKVNFNNELDFGFGVEAEFIFPFNKNKWTFAIEPTYQSFNSEETINSDYIGGTKLIVNVDYNSIEVPLSLRHYFFFNKNSKLFINASYVLDFSFNSSILFKSPDNFIYDDLKLKSNGNFAMGIGYKFEDKYSMEMRYQFDRDILPISESYVWDAKYNAISVIFGYTIF